MAAHQRTVGQRHLQANDLLAHVAVTNRAQAAGVGRRHAADGRGVTGGQIHAEHQARRARGTLHRGQRRSGTHLDTALDGVHIAKGTQSLGGQQHVVMLGNRAGNQRGATALHGDVRPGVATYPQHLGDLLGRTGPHQCAGPAAIAAGVVHAPAGQHVGVYDDMVRSHQRRQPAQHVCGHRTWRWYDVR